MTCAFCANSPEPFLLPPTMKISINWLRDYLPEVPSVGEFAEMLTFAGVEVEDIQHTGANIANVVVARILSSEKHPDADRLSVCTVDDGTGTPRQIVCGAKNYKVQDCVPLALPGAVLPGAVKIKAGKLRGIKSEGMLCSGKELGLGDDSAGLLILPKDAAPGTPIGKLFPGDTFVEIEITPNRPDLLSHFGIARETASLISADVRWPAVTAPHENPDLPRVSVTVAAPKQCPYYTARRIKGVTVRPSPPWLAARLESVGIRPINNIVDVTNYVMLELGQPLHAFDAAKLNGGVCVRLARPDEQLLALDGKTYGLAGDALIIADATRPIALAGIMGGEESGVTASTTEIILESAYFEPAQIRRTSRSLCLTSDSSYRFERGVNPGGVKDASDRAAQLILELAGGEAGCLEEVIAPEWTSLNAPWEVTMRYDRCRSLLGADISNSRIDELLRRLGLAKKNGDDLRAAWTIPLFRGDLRREVDLIEEVVRTAGMTIIKTRTSGFFAPASADDEAHDLRMAIARRLVGAGFFEVRTLALISKAAAAADPFGKSSALLLRNPMSEDHAVMRPSLLPGLFSTADANFRNGAATLRLFEIGAVYDEKGADRCCLALLLSGPQMESHWRAQEERALDIFDLKGALQLLLPVRFMRRADARQPLDLDILVDGKPAGRAGQIAGDAARAIGARNPVLVAEMELQVVMQHIRRAPKYRAVAKFPAVRRDIALVGPRGVAHEQIVSVIIEAGGDLLESATLFDVFTDDSGEKLPADARSMAYALTFRAADRTLKDSDVAAVHERIVHQLSDKLQLTLRAQETKGTP